MTDAEVTFSVCNGMADAEIEDMFDTAVYEAVVANRFKVTLQSPKFSSSKKWSERMRDTFRQQGKQWDDRVEADVKRWVAEAVAADPGRGLNPHKRSAFDALIQVLVERVEKKP